ncbi:Rv3235 family protein [Lysinibacter cavernae]|uniref:3-hydroxyacyl-CoA dehydrogenase n=1 Tax=Lysinibacter cavernae TaxID=1640652 RepID=A0A7X5R3K0_9MICO|nr:Rv3235 family protein [Lysinibacter cavernae]NIH55034.1 hypothetical protein [Lysinibacter cavernae]
MHTPAARQPDPSGQQSNKTSRPRQLTALVSATQVSPADDFGPQPTSRSALPDPVPLLRNLAMSTVEVLQCTRDLDGMARWVTEGVYQAIKYRQSLALNRYSITGSPPQRIPHACGSVHYSEPSDGVIEAVVLVHSKDRTRAVAIRLEGLDNRWRATALAVL